MKHVIKIGAQYLGANGELVDSQRQALKFSDDEDRPRVVNVRPHGSAPTSTASTDSANRLLDGSDADTVQAPDLDNDGVVVTVGAVTVRITINN